MNKFHKIYNILKFLLLFLTAIILLICSYIFVLMKIPENRKNTWVPAIIGIICSCLLYALFLTKFL